ncbi:MAG TPA: mechanosensitive ion channel family protein, partial [candidate division Zixibacteria bacterium]|nr:mechanosensitive ion channel family protein [candidate division Zixibacteria bacterium]
IVGVALGFGSQRLVEDVISGFFILVEDQIRVGDVIQTGDKNGVVEKVGLRMTVLRDLNGHVHFIRNGKIDIVSNMTKDYSYALFDIGVAYREDTDEVVKVIEAVAAGMQDDPDFAEKILEPIKVLGVDHFADSAVIIKCRFKTQPGDQWKVRREFNRRLKKAFDTKDIEIPFPHRTIYIGDPKTSAPTALPVRQVSEERSA